MAKKKSKSTWVKMVDYGLHRIAHYAFFLGLIFAIVIAIINTFLQIHTGTIFMKPSDLLTTLFLVGLVVGIFNLTAKEVTPFLVAAIALMLSGIVNLGLIDLYNWWPNFGTYLIASLSNIVVFVVPVAIVVGFKAVWELAS